MAVGVVCETSTQPLPATLRPSPMPYALEDQTALFKVATLYFGFGAPLLLS